MPKIPTQKEINAFIGNLPLIKTLIDWSKVNSFPGFSRVPWYDVILFIRNELQRDNITTRANSMAFSFFLSLFPTIIMLFTLIPLVLPYILPETLLSYLPDGNYNFNETVTSQMRDVLPDNMEDQLITFIESVTTKPRFGLLSFGFFLAIFFSSNGMMTMMRGFQKSHTSTFVRRTGLQRRLLAIALTFLIGFLLIVSVVLIVLGNNLIGFLLDYINADSFTSISLYLLRWFVSFFIIYFGISALYRYGAATIRRFEFFSPGATLATLLIILSSLIFSFYVDNFSVYNKLYGSIGTIIVSMLWIQINSFIILVGFELNASIAVNRDLKKQIPES